jgi:hypothetical protein
MLIQSTLQIAEVIHHAVVFDPKNGSGGLMNSDSLIHAVQDLFAVLELRRIDYVLVGGIALLHYVEGRNTQDLDLIITLSTLAQLPELHVSNQELYFARAAYGDLQIDLLLTQNPLFKKVQDGYTQTAQFLDRRIPIATVEGLLLLKLYALPSLYRQGNFARVGLYENDIATLLQAYRPDLPPLLAELANFVSESDLAETKTILTEIQERINRFKKQSGG